MSYEIVDVVPDTSEWLQERRSSVGASEAGALVGDSSYGATSLSVYLDKIGQSRDSFHPIKSLVTHAAEPIVQQVMEILYPELGTLEPGFMARRPDAPWLHATFDRILVEPDGRRVPFQIKTASPFDWDRWDDGAPAQYLAQEDVECFILDDAPYAYLAVWFWGSNPEDFHLHKLPYRPERAQALSDAAKDLMGHVERREPPRATILDDLAALYPAPEFSQVTADADAQDAVDLYRELGEQIKDLTAVRKDASQEIALFLGEHDATDLYDPRYGQVIHTWRPDSKGSRRHQAKKVK